MKDNSSTWMLALGTLALSTLLAPGAIAGCGAVLASRLSVQIPAEQPLSRSTQSQSTPSEKLVDSASTPVSVVGMWTTTVSLGGQPIYQAFESFTSDGLEFLNDNGSPLEGNVCFGVWTGPSRNSVKVYHPAWNYDMNGNLIGTVVIKEVLTVDPGGNSFKGTVVVDSYDLNGNVSSPELQATIGGKRVTFEMSWYVRPGGLE